MGVVAALCQYATRAQYSPWGQLTRIASPAAGARLKAPRPLNSPGARRRVQAEVSRFGAGAPWPGTLAKPECRDGSSPRFGTPHARGHRSAIRADHGPISSPPWRSSPWETGERGLDDMVPLAGGCGCGNCAQSVRQFVRAVRVPSRPCALRHHNRQ